MSNVKDLVKIFLIKTNAYHIYESYRFKKHYSRAESIAQKEFLFSFNAVPNSKDSVYAKIRLRIHGIEKQLVKGDSPKIETVLMLFEQTERLLKEYPEYSRSGDAVKETIGIALSVIEEKKAKGVECSKLENILKDFINRNNLQNTAPRIIKIQTIKSDNRPKDYSVKYDSFVRERHSVRELSPQKIDLQSLKEIVETALICPSAANRQPCKVYYPKESEKIRELLPDKYVSKDVYNFLIVTINKSFYSSAELFSPWIDGGIFINSLVMAIHSRGLGSCLFQYLKTNPNYQSFKETVGIPENEDIICCVGLGYPKNEYNIIETHRKDIDEILIEF